MPRLAVIIPYYQRTVGILREALSSVLAQELPADVSVDVIVVDDGSPSPATADTAGLSFAAPFNLTLIQQPNAGAAAARNEGLRQIIDGTDYIAFLDSDDIWKAGHIVQAATALSEGCDFYFSDHSRVGFHGSHFALIDFPPSDAPAGSLKQLSGPLWEIDSRFFFEFFLRRFTAQISTVVYRRATHPTATFQPSLHTSGEDYLFLLEVVSKADKVCFTSEAGVICGAGVNIYYSTFGWDDEGHLRRHMADMLAAYAFRSKLKLSDADAAFLRRRIAGIRANFAFFTARWRLKMRGPWSPELVELTRADPTFWKWYPLALLSVGVRYPLRLFRPA
jgi:succinoglycan biosynthesis protein ExoW